jgi:hypothetical protein
MQATNDTITSRQSEQVTDQTHRPASDLASAWARGRRRLTPWAYSHIRALATLRLTIGLFLAGVGALLIAHGHDGWAVIPLAGAALHFSVGSLDMTVIRYARPRA